MIEKKDIPSYEQFYEADELGRIFSKGRIDCLGRYWPSCEMSQLKSHGYLAVSLSNGEDEKRILSHRLIAKTFIPNPENKRCVNHINGIKHDNRKVNLEWSTHSENNIHANKIGLVIHKRGNEHGHSKGIIQFDVYGTELNRFGSIKEAARFLDKPKGNGSISNAANGVTKSAYGFNWALVQ